MSTRVARPVLQEVGGEATVSGQLAPVFPRQLHRKRGACRGTFRATPDEQHNDATIFNISSSEEIFLIDL